MSKVVSHAYLLRGSPSLFADVRAVSLATGVSMAVFIRGAIDRALVEANARRGGEVQ